MNKIEAVIRHFKLEEVKEALTKAGVKITWNGRQIMGLVELVACAAFYV